MKEVQVETKSFKTIYRAIDGTDFTNKEDCEQYEQSARGVIMGRFKRLVIAETDEWELLKGDDEHGVYALKIESQTDIDIVLQAYYLDNPYMLKDDENRAKYRKRYESLCDRAYKEKDLLLMGTNCDGELYFLDTRNAFIERLNNLDKPKEEEFKNEA
jgi:hypothetical protein